MGSTTTVARKVVSSSTLIGPFKIWERAQIQQPLVLALKFKPVLWVVSYVTKTSLVFKETRGHAWQEAGRELSPLVSFSLIMRNLCWQRTFLDARERNLSKSRHGQVVCGETLSIVGENSLPSFKTTSNFTLFRVAPCLKLKYKGWYRHFSALKITLL